MVYTQTRFGHIFALVSRAILSFRGSQSAAAPFFEGKQASRQRCSASCGPRSTKERHRPVMTARRLLRRIEMGAGESR